MAKPSFVLGLLGGIFGFFFGILALIIGGVGGAVGAVDAGTITKLSIAAILFSLLTIVFSVVSIYKPRIGGWLLIVSGTAILISISAFGILPAILIVVGGITALLRKKT